MHHLRPLFRGLRPLPQAWLATCLLAGMAGSPTLASTPTESGQARHAAWGHPDSGQVIVKFRSGASVLPRQVLAANPGAARSGPQAASTLATRLGLAGLTNGPALNTRTQLVLGSGVDSQTLATRLAADPEVEWAVVNGRRHALAVPNDPLYPDGQALNSLSAGQWYLRAPTAAVPGSANVEAAWGRTQGRSDMVVAVLDTGMRPDHPDLAAKWLPGRDFITDVSTANDGDGWDADPTDPGDWITSAENQSGTFKGCGTSNSSWHGTLVAGIVGAATQNGIGIAGTAPNTLLLPVRVLGKCGGDDLDIIAAMRWAAGLSVPGVSDNPHPAKVLNLSLGGPGTCTSAYLDTLSELASAGVVVVAAAGNEGTAVGVPANCSGVLAVGGLRHAGTKSGFSSLGPEVAISAPGGNCVNDVDAHPNLPCLYGILSTTNTGSRGPVAASYSDATNYELGTSFSTPIVAGTVALMLSIHPDLTPVQVRELLQSSARSFASTGGSDATIGTCQAPSATVQSECYCTTRTCGAGMLDTGAAVAAAAALGGRPSASIQTLSSRISAGQPLVLDGSGSQAEGTGRSLVSRSWQLLSGSDLASWSGTTSDSTATLAAQAAGTVIARLTVTDSTGQSTSADQVIQVLSTPVARITASDNQPAAGSAITLSASTSEADGLASIASYQWDLVSGSDRARWGGATNEQTAVLELTSAGEITVRLTLTDSLGATASSTQILTVGSAPSGGSGGGAMSPWWVIGLAILGLALPRRPARPKA